jgi:hypothetical protein
VARTPHTAKRRLAETLLKEPLSVFVSRHRDAGESWRQISLDIRENIDLDIHPETLRLWYVELTAAKAS